jgi:hypothetical protein
MSFSLLAASASSLLCFASDRATKSFFDQRAALHLSLGRAGSLHLVVSRRPRPPSDRIVLVATWCAALVCAIVLRLRSGWFEGPAAVLGLGAAFGGAAGNLLDVLRGRPIIDFIDFRFWPAFNVADIAIVVGLSIAFLSAL